MELKISQSLVKQLPFTTRRKWETKKRNVITSNREKLMAKAVVKEKKDKQVRKLTRQKQTKICAGLVVYKWPLLLYSSTS